MRVHVLTPLQAHEYLIEFDLQYKLMLLSVYLSSVRIEDFSAKKRTKSIAYPRQIAMYLSRELTDFSLPKIGEEFGGRDHTTVIHAHEKISNDNFLNILNRNLFRFRCLNNIFKCFSS